MKTSLKTFNIQNNLIVNAPPLKEKLISICLSTQPQEVERILAHRELEVSMYENIKV